HHRTRWHVDSLEHGSTIRIDAPKLALGAFRGAVPQVALHPRHARDEAVRLDGAEDRARLGIDLMNLPRAILAYPERPFGPRESRVTAAGGCWNRRYDAPGIGIDLLDTRLGDLIEEFAVERRTGVRGHIDGAQLITRRRVECAHRIAGG